VTRVNLFTRAICSLCLGSCALLSGCATDPKDGYSTQSTFDTNVRTISVPIFDNYTYRPDLAVALTEAVAKEIARTTPWAVTNTSNADTVLKGVIRSEDLRKLSQDPNSGLVQEQAVSIVIDFEWRDTRSNKAKVVRRRFTGVDTFVPVRGTGERLETGEYAAIDRLARAIVGELRSAW
jgi:hypothetical protein